jgi:hypothetical protein
MSPSLSSAYSSVILGSTFDGIRITFNRLSFREVRHINVVSQDIMSIAGGWVNPKIARLGDLQSPRLDLFYWAHLLLVDVERTE